MTKKFWIGLIIVFIIALIGVSYQKFLKIAAFSIILIATLNLNGAIALTGSRFTIENIWAEAYCTIFTFCNNKVLAAQTQITNVATINIESNGYSPKNLSVKAGSPVTLHLVNQNAGGCTQVFTIPSLGIQKIITRGNSDTIQFTAPRKAGKLAFMCSMGMYRGEIEVI